MARNNNNISVIIPTLNPGQTIGELINRLWRQTTPPTEIIVIDSSSTDDSQAIAAAAGAKVVVIHRSEFNHGATRNHAVEVASGELLVFMTQDALPYDDFYLEALTNPIRSGLAEASYARQIPYSNASPIEAFTRSFNYPATSSIKSADDISKLGIKAYFCSNVSCCFSNAIFRNNGGFPDDIIINEEICLSSKIIHSGGRVAYQADALVFHSHDYSLTQQFKRYFDTGVSHWRLRNLLVECKTEKEGAKFTLGLFKHLLKIGRMDLIPRAMLEIAYRYTGYTLGKFERLLPLRIKRILSMHAFYWNRQGTNAPTR